MDRLTYRDDTGRARLTRYGVRMYCSTQATADCFAELEESIPRWISVKERLPEDGKYVLAYSADDDYMTVEARHKFDAFQITHWMPLPEPPKEEK